MPRDCSSSAMPRTVVIPERLMSSTMPRRSAARWAALALRKLTGQRHRRMACRFRRKRQAAASARRQRGRRPGRLRHRLRMTRKPPRSPPPAASADSPAFDSPLGGFRGRPDSTANRPRGFR